MPRGSLRSDTWEVSDRNAASRGQTQENKGGDRSDRTGYGSDLTRYPGRVGQEHVQAENGDKEYDFEAPTPCNAVLLSDKNCKKNTFVKHLRVTHLLKMSSSLFNRKNRRSCIGTEPSYNIPGCLN